MSGRKSEGVERRAITSLVHDGNLIEIIFNPSTEQSYLIWADANSPELGVMRSETLRLRKPGIALDLNGRKPEDRDLIEYVPLINNTVREGAVILPDWVEEYGTTEDLIDEIRAFIHDYLDITEEIETFATYYVLISWVYDRLTTVPYLRFLGDFGTGKSRALKTIGRLCYKPILTSGAATASPIYRMQSVWKGTLVIDEGDRKKSDEADDITKILNCGFEKGIPVLRSNKDDPNDIEAHDAFGPKVISSRFPFYDQALESRCITENMRETSRKLPIVLTEEFFERQNSLRRKLLLFRLREWKNIDPKNVKLMDIEGLEPRLKQAVSAFGILFCHRPELFEKFKKFIKSYQNELVLERSQTIEGQIVTYLLENRKERITPTELTLYLQEKLQNTRINPRSVGKRLRALGFDVKIEWNLITSKAERIIDIKEEVLEKVKERYVVQHKEDETENREVKAEESFIE